jgi:hypothetical protein
MELAIERRAVSVRSEHGGRRLERTLQLQIVMPPFAITWNGGCSGEPEEPGQTVTGRQGFGRSDLTPRPSVSPDSPGDSVTTATPSLGMAASKAPFLVVSPCSPRPPV